MAGRPKNDEEAIRILLIEDDPVCRAVFAKFFEHVDDPYVCTPAASIAEARRCLSDGDFDVVIADYKLGDGTAFDVIEMEVEAPIIFVTGRGDEETAVKALKAGAFDYLTKDRDNRYLQLMPITIRNAIARKKAQDAWRLVQFEHSMAGIFRCLPTGEFVQFNKTLADLLGYDPELEADGARGLHQHLDAGELRDFVATLESRSLVQNYELELRRDNGAPLCALVNAHLIEDPSGSGDVIEATLLDITGRKRMEKDRLRLEEQLQHAQKMEALGTLAGGIAHDFNNLLTAIGGYAELALMDVSPESETADNLREVLAAGNRAREIVQQIINFSRQSEPRRRLVNMREVIDQAVKLVQPGKSPRVEIVRSVETQSGTILADAAQMNQVLMNLLTNSLQAMGDSGTLTVTLEDVEVGAEDEESELSPGKYLRLLVEDTGGGIEAENLTRVFEPFFTTKPVGKGTGLGLSVVHGIVKQHRGHIEIAAEAGAGTSVAVYLPHMAERRAAGRDVEEAIGIVGGTEKVLLVEDDEAVEQMLRLMLERLGYGVVSRPTGRSALNELQADPKRFDVVITDHMMPEMNGLELAGEIHHMKLNLPIVLCTGMSREGVEEEGRKRGVTAYLSKPVNLLSLSSTVREALVDVSSA